MIESPNKHSGWGNNTIQGCVVHYTASPNLAGSYSWFMNQDSKASAHVLIDHDGTVKEVVSPNNRAYHAGISSWGGITGCNNFMLGIELVNVGKVTSVIRDGKEVFITAYKDRLDGQSAYDLVTKKSYEIFYDPQIKACIDLLKYWQGKYKFSSSWVVGHSHVAPGRKTDPGPLFPWKLLETELSLNNYESLEAKALQSHLERLDYEVGTIDGKIGKLTRSALSKAITDYRLFNDLKDVVIYSNNLVDQIISVRVVNDTLRRIPWAGYKKEA